MNKTRVVDGVTNTDILSSTQSSQPLQVTAKISYNAKFDDGQMNGQRTSYRQYRHLHNKNLACLFSDKKSEMTVTDQLETCENSLHELISRKRGKMQHKHSHKKKDNCSRTFNLS